MATPSYTPRFTTPAQSLGSKALGGGLNTTAGPLHLEDNESSDLLNIDFDKFGSILKRNGYVAIGLVGGDLVSYVTNTDGIVITNTDGTSISTP